MDSSAIKQIQESSCTKDVMQRVDDVVSTYGKNKSSVVAIPESMQLVSVEKYMGRPARHRLSFTTPSLKDFSAYCIENAKDGESSCFIDTENMTAVAIFDLGRPESPGHKEHTATLELQKTKKFAAFRGAVSERKFSQRELSDFLEDWADSLVIKNNKDETMETATAIQGVRKLTIEAAREGITEVGDFSSKASVMERVEAKQQETLPVSFGFKCIPYQSLSERWFKVKIRLLTGGEKPFFTLRGVGLETQTEEMLEEFKGLLDAELKDSSLSVYLGTV